MTTSHSKRDFLKSEKADLLRKELQAMVDDPRYNTLLRYSIATPDGSNFIAKHMEYMSCHPTMNHEQYVSNLKLMTKLQVPN